MSTFDLNDAINRIYIEEFGREGDTEGKAWWGDHYGNLTTGENALTSEQALAGIRKDFQHHDEWHTPFAQNRREALASIGRGSGVRAGSIASYSDKFNEDGTLRDDWVDVETWNQNKIESLMADVDYLNNELANATTTGGGGSEEVTTGTEEVTTGGTGVEDGIRDARYANLQGAYNSLQSSISGYATRLNDLQKAYDQQSLDMQNVWNNANWDQNRTSNPMVRGVKTQNELPGYNTRTGGARGFFGRGTGGNMLKTSSLNI